MKQQTKGNTKYIAVIKFGTNSVMKSMKCAELDLLSMSKFGDVVLGADGAVGFVGEAEMVEDAVAFVNEAEDIGGFIQSVGEEGKFV